MLIGAHNAGINDDAINQSPRKPSTIPCHFRFGLQKPKIAMIAPVIKKFVGFIINATPETIAHIAAKMLIHACHICYLLSR